MSDIGIVAGILDNSGGRGVFVLPRQRQGEARALAARQRHFDRIGKVAGDERGKCRLRRRRGAGAGSPAPAQRAILPLHHFPFSPARRQRHHGRANP